MKIRVQKTPVIQWIVLFFLLLCIPLALFIFQNQTIGDIRSKAGVYMNKPLIIRGKIGSCTTLTCSASEKKVPLSILRSRSCSNNNEDCDVTDDSAGYCQCQPLISPTPRPTFTPTPSGSYRRLNGPNQ